MMGGDVGDLNLRHCLFFEASRPQKVEGCRYLVRALSWRDGPASSKTIENNGNVDFKSLVKLK